MAKLLTFNEDAHRRVARATLRLEGVPINGRPGNLLTVHSGNAGFQIYNDTEETIPIGGACYISSYIVIDGQTYTQVVKPTGSNIDANRILINGTSEIEPEEIGTAYGYSAICFAAYDDEQSPLTGQKWGPKADSWELQYNAAGFMALGIGDGLLVCVRVTAASIEQQMRLAKTNATHNKGSSGNVTIWSGTKGSESATAETVSVYNRWGNLNSDVFVTIAYVDTGWEIINADACT